MSRNQDLPHRPRPESALPTGTVTFLFTDIEGSTRLWQVFPAAMKDALVRHHAVLQQSIEAHNGHVFQIVGDAFCAAFPTAPEAGSARWRAPRGPRRALHTGSVEVRARAYRSANTPPG